ncbi:MAG: DUF169 domain-containing protein [Candidatus Bathyarchaeia archaeon]
MKSKRVNSRRLTLFPFLRKYLKGWKRKRRIKMVDLKDINDALNTYIRPQSFPVAVKMCQRKEMIPEKARFPKKDLGISITLCQGIAMTRRYGWTIALGKEDQICPHGLVVLGFVPGKGYRDGTMAEKIGLWTREEFVRISQGLSFLEYGRYLYILCAPIHSARFTPDFIMIYGNPAQVARLVQGATVISGRPLSFSTTGGIGCSTYVARTILTDECQVVLAGAGDRYFALTQDHELAFTIPMSKAETVIKGLELGHRKFGHRYPTPSWLRFQGPIPEEYRRFTDLLLAEE